MRVYHFMSRKYGVQNLFYRRLKIATLDDINDPFELIATASSDADERRAFRGLRRDWAKRFGMLCFSRSWHNPVQWSHYAEKHRGLCFGFDVPDDLLVPVTYSTRRITADWNAIGAEDEQRSHEEIIRWSSTKFDHWKYEEESRMFLKLDSKDPDEDLHFVEFCQELKLREIIVGALSDLTRDDIDRLIGSGDMMSVDRFKVRLAFNTYLVVRQRQAGLWK